MPTIVAPPLAPKLVSVASRLRHFLPVYAELETGTSPVPTRGITAPDGMRPLDQQVSAEFIFFGIMSAGTAMAFSLYAIRLTGRNDVDPLKVYEPYLYGSGTATAGAGAMVNGGELAGKHYGTPTRMCDEVDFSLAPFGTYVESMTGQNFQPFSPGDDSAPAVLGIPDIGGAMAGFVLVLDNPTGQLGVNAAYALWT
jgi:hypothetical protein